ncbi:MAG: crossover junction endodeoxyribonuclease RuvC [Candidatus Magasanikbacteria bacterium]|nr:crossover junction endodeoxyribonuclease RuvC [Candidatus Magasanikbacteria bacterium]
MIEKKVEYILGVDPGYGRVGYGIIKKEKGNYIYVDHGCIETSPKQIFVDRLETVFKELEKIVKKYPITYSAVEDLFFAKNVKTAIAVAQARGAILLTLKLANLPIYEFTPLQIKQALTGYGRADKKQVEKMVIVNLGKLRKEHDDAVDALAIALTCGATLKFSHKAGIFRK